MPANATISMAGTTLVQESAIGQPRWLDKYGSGNAPSGSYTLANGTGNDLGNVLYRGNASGLLNVPAGGSVTISLKGTNGETDAINNALSMASVKLIHIERVSTSGCVSFGPNGNATKANLGFDSDGSFAFGEVFLAVDKLSGWAISAGAANVTFSNAGGTDVVIKPRFFGVGG